MSFFGHFPRVHSITFNSLWGDPFVGLTSALQYETIVEAAGLVIKFLNADIRGSLVDVFKMPKFYNESGYNLFEKNEGEVVVFARIPMRYRAADVLVYHEAIDLFCATADKRFVRELLQDVSSENTDDGGRLSTALLFDCAKEMFFRSSSQLFYRGRDFLDHSTIKVAFNEAYYRSSGGSGSGR